MTNTPKFERDMVGHYDIDGNDGHWYRICKNGSKWQIGQGEREYKPLDEETKDLYNRNDIPIIEYHNHNINFWWQWKTKTLKEAKEVILSEKFDIHTGSMSID